MRDKWKKIILKDLCDFNKESYSSKDKWEYINYLDTKNITENKIYEIQYLNTVNDKIPSRARRKVKVNDIILSTVRPNQKHYGIISEKITNLLVSTGFVTITPNKDKVDPNFLYYIISQDYITQFLHDVAEQSTSAYPSIRPSDLLNLELFIPPLKIQRNISLILNYIDELIRVNEKINKNLIYKITNKLKDIFKFRHLKHQFLQTLV